MHVSKLLSLCKVYSNMGWSVQGQLEQFMDGEDIDDLNPNALKMIHDFFALAVKYGYDGSADQADYIKEYLEENKPR